MQPVNGSKAPHIDVACGVVIDREGRVLLAQRPAGKIAAGKWEFPGGKIERDETVEAALARELEEEVGVIVRSAEQLLRFTHHYLERSVSLHCWQVRDFEGQPSSREGQQLGWWTPAALAQAIAGGALPVLPTVAPILAALSLPRHYVFTPADASEDWIRSRLHWLPTGALLRLRLPRLDPAEYTALAGRLLPACLEIGLRLMLDRDPERVGELGAAGWHATESAMCGLDARPPRSCGYFAASVHDAGSLALAAGHRADLVVLGPVQPTPTHPGAESLGWNRFSTLIATAGTPVYAIGGLGPADIDRCRSAGAFGVAGIRGFWEG